MTEEHNANNSSANVIINDNEYAENIVETVRTPLLVLDADLRVISSNRSFHRTFQVAPEETDGVLVYELGNGQWDIPLLRNLLEEIIPSNIYFDDYEIEHEFEAIGKRIMLLNARRINRESEGTHLILLAIEDMTERKRFEKLLKDSEELYRRVFETARDGIFLLEKDKGKTIDINPAVTAMLGYSKNECTGKTIQEIGCKLEFDDIHFLAKKLIDVEIVSYNDVQFETKSGQIIDTDIYMVNKTQYIQCNVRDITENKRIKTQLAHTQKMESIGLLAGGIAHDFNNILGIIIGNVVMAKDQVDNSEVNELLKEAETASRRAQSLTQQLLTFAKGGTPVKEIAAIKDIIKGSASFVTRGSKSRCEFEIPEDIYSVEADTGQFDQVISNVVINADQAMPDGGIIRIKAQNIALDEGNIWKLNPGRYVKISIKDEGIGIPEEYLSKIFDPYFSTKQTGSGLGLATGYSIIKNHGGLVTAESDMGTGATFHIYMPASDTQASEKDISKRPIKGKGRILVSDDDAALRKMLKRMLENLGYKADFAKDGAEAIELFKAAKDSGNPYDAVILDLTIPGGTGGKEAAEKLIEIDPEVKAIVSSGYSDDPVLANFQKYGFKGRMPKPFESLSLSKVLHEVLKGEEE